MPFHVNDLARDMEELVLPPSLVTMQHSKFSAFSDRLCPYTYDDLRGFDDDEKEEEEEQIVVLSFVPVSRVES